MADLKGRRVLIGTPAYDWNANIRFVHSLGMTVKLCAEKGIDLRWLFPPGKIVTQARNELARDALNHGFDDLVFIDADQDWEPKDLIWLLSYDVDCVGAAIRKKSEDVLWNVKARGGIFSFVKHPKYDLLTAPDLTIGTGFLRLSRRALQALWDASEKYTSDGQEEAAWIFHFAPRKGELISEDTHVCDLLRGLGIPTWLDPKIACGHSEGGKRYIGDFAAWLSEMQAASRPRLVS